MNNLFRNSIAIAALTVVAAGANAAMLHNQNVTNNVIMGTGIINGGFTTATDASTGVQVGLRARERYDLATNQPTNVTGSNNNGTFNQNAGEPPGFPASNRARWNFDWSINTGTLPVSTSAYSYSLSIDFDAGVGTNFLTFDLINGVNPSTASVFWDHSFGNNATAQSQGAEAVDAAGYAGLKAASNLVQNSWNMDFFDGGLFAFDPNANGNYTFVLSLSGAQGVLASSEITVIVGASAVPEPGSLALAGVALAGLFGVSRRKRS